MLLVDSAVVEDRIVGTFVVALVFVSLVALVVVSSFLHVDAASVVVVVLIAAFDIAVVALIVAVQTAAVVALIQFDVVSPAPVVDFDTSRAVSNDNNLY